MHLDKNKTGKEQRGAYKRNEEYLREVGKIRQHRNREDEHAKEHRREVLFELVPAAQLDSVISGL